MRSDTTEKLGEAIYFHVQMKAAFEENRPEYIYLANAFISAARSVTFVMNKEYAHVKGFKAWWKNNEDINSPLFEKFNTLRVITEHEKMVSQASVRFGTTFNFGTGLESKDGVVLAGINFEGDKPTAFVHTINEDGSERAVDGVAGEVERDFTITEYHKDGKKEVKIESFLADADAYFEKIKQMVNECESKFSLPIN